MRPRQYANLLDTASRFRDYPLASKRDYPAQGIFAPCIRTQLLDRLRWPWRLSRATGAELANLRETGRTSWNISMSDIHTHPLGHLLKPSFFRLSGTLVTSRFDVPFQAPDTVRWAPSFSSTTRDRTCLAPARAPMSDRIRTSACPH